MLVISFFVYDKKAQKFGNISGENHFGLVSAESSLIFVTGGNRLPMSTNTVEQNR